MMEPGTPQAAWIALILLASEIHRHYNSLVGVSRVLGLTGKTSQVETEESIEEGLPCQPEITTRWKLT
jgi:hypothetical protein